MPYRKLIVVTLIACLAAQGASGQVKKRPGAEPAGGSARELIEQANQALKQNDEPRALKLYEQARGLKDFSTARVQPALIMAAGDQAFALGTPEGFEQALSTYSSVIDSPLAATIDRGIARVRRAEVLLRQDKPQAAKDEMTAVRAAPGSRKSLVIAELGDASIALHLNQAESARDKLLPLLESEEPVIRAMALFSLGRAYVQLKQPDQAVAAFRKLWNQYGETSFVKRAVFLVGGIYLDRGDFMEARKLFEACSVIGAPMQSRVLAGDELIIKVSDPNYFARTRNPRMPVLVWTPSGDKETLLLDKNPVSDVLYTGRIQTALAPTPAAADGTLQVRGSDEIELSYEGQVAPPRKILVVDDGRINIDSSPMSDPAPRNTKALAPTPRKPAAEGKAVIASARQAASAINPGSPVYVQIADADLDTSDQPDKVTAQVVAHGGRGDSASVAVVLTETGPHTSVFTASMPTAAATASTTASSESAGHPAFAATDVDALSPAPAGQINPGGKATYWQGKPGEKTYWLEVDLRQPAFLSKLTWGPGNDPLAEKCAPIAMTVSISGDNTAKTIPFAGKPKPTGNEIDLGGIFARYVRIEITKFTGEAPAIGQFILTDTAGKQLMPNGIDAEAASKRGVLEFDVGQTISARYTDDENFTPGIPTVRESRRLGAAYNDASIHIATRAEGKADDKNPASYSPMFRLDLSAQPHIVVSDSDVDTTPNPDKLTLDLFTESGIKRTIDLTETGGSTGTFAAALPVTENAAAKDDPRFLYVRPGDLVWMTFMDERNMKPGYRTFRNEWVLENRPTAGEIAPLSLLQTAWPYEVKGDEEIESLSAMERPANASRLTLTLTDADALSRSGQSVPAKAVALLSGVSRELTFSSSAQGQATRTLDLVLGDKDSSPAEPSPSTTDLNVAGDDVIRLAYTDQKIPTNDLQTRRVYTEAEFKALEKNPTARAAADAPAAKILAAPGAAAPAAVEPEVLPLIRLRDPQRRLAIDQDARLADLRRELGRRVAGYGDEIKTLTAKRDQLKTRLAAIAIPTKPVGEAKPASGAKPTSNEPISSLAPNDDALKASIAAIDVQITLLTQRVKRLQAMGAVADAKEPPAPAPIAEPANPKSPETLPLTPGQPFVITVDDADLTTPTLDLRVRSVAGRMVDLITVKATRDPAGLYTARVETERSGEAGDPKMLSLLPGGEVLVDYADTTQKEPTPTDRVTYVALAADARLDALNPNFSAPVSEIRLGEAVQLQVIDFDQDRSPTQDRIIVSVKASTGDTLMAILTETEPHSGTFRGSFATDRAQPNPNDDTLQADYGGSVILTYADHLRATPSTESIKTLTLKIAGGADGTIEGFSRQFRDAKDEMQLWYRTGLAAYQLGRKLYLSHSLERAEEHFAEATDYFSQLARRFPEDPLAASANYYLGNIQSLKGRHTEALARFQEVVSRWPKSEFVAAARFKIGQSFESLGQFESAADAYVLLTYHHTTDERVPSAMIRMMNHYARLEDWPDAVAIAEKFVDKFPDHAQAGAVALKAGQWLAVGEKPSEALAWFARSEKVFATKDKEMPALLYWHAATILSNGKGQIRGNAPRAEKVRELLNRLVYDYPTNEYVPMAKIALEQMQEKK